MLKGEQGYQLPSQQNEVQETVHTPDKKTTRCSTRHWLVILVVTVVLLIIAVVGIVVLAVRLQRALQPVTFVEAVKKCTICQPCYSCLQEMTGQDVSSLCLAEDTSTVYQCASQIIFLYSKPNTGSSKPCHSECRPCRDCLHGIDAGPLNLTAPLLQTLHSQIFENETAVGDYVSACSIYCDEVFNCSWQCSFFEGNIRRFKRRISDDGDACCQTEREELPYLENYEDDEGTTWHPVWFHDPDGFPNYSFQTYDEIHCPLGSPQCDSQLTCTFQAESRSMIMSTLPPNRTYGYYYTIFTFSDNNVKFIKLGLPSYCKCTN